MPSKQPKTVMKATSATIAKKAGSLVVTKGKPTGRVMDSPVLKAQARTHAALQKKYDELGGAATFGAPPPKKFGGRWDFPHQSLVYNAKESAAYLVKGAILDKWMSLGAEKSYLGRPTSDEGDIDEGGRASGFQNGWIYWWGDTGAIDLRDIVVTYVGLHAYSESDKDQSSGSDEPYCILSVVAPKRDPVTLRSQTYEGVDDRTVRPDRVELYRGPAYGLTVGVVAMEGDFGSAEANRVLVEQAVMTNHEVGKFMLQFIPLVGPIISKIAGPALDKVMPPLANGIASVLDLGDDIVGTDSVALSTRKLVTLATRGSVYRAANKLPYKVESAMMEGGGARYKALFSVDPA